MQDLSQLKVPSNEKVRDLFDFIPDSLLNLKSGTFVVDFDSMDNRGPQKYSYYQEFIGAKFKDGNYKSWFYYRSLSSVDIDVNDKFNTLSNFPSMCDFLNNIDFLYHLPASEDHLYIDSFVLP